MGKKNYKRELTLIELNPEYNVIYQQLRKESRIWNSTGQYWLGKECNRRADALLRGDIGQYNTVKHSHELYHYHI
jgi:hypothetical protein